MFACTYVCDRVHTMYVCLFPHVQMSSHMHVQLSEAHKHASISLSDVGVATSSFYDLDNTTSWVS